MVAPTTIPTLRVFVEPDPATNIAIPQKPKKRIGRNCRSGLKLDQPREARKLKKVPKGAEKPEFRRLYHSGNMVT
jgi:hypothetical protein